MNAADLIREADEIVDRHGADITAAIGMLQDIQARYGYLPKESLVRTAERLSVPLSQVYALATFYRAFSLKPRGAHHICVCVGTACHVRGAERLVDEIGRRLAIAPGETSGDGAFSLEEVNCVGACALGPLLTVDGEYHGRMSPRKVASVLERCRGKERAGGTAEQSG